MPREELLNSYSPERSAVGDEVLKSAATLTTVGTLKNPFAQTIRNLVGHIMLGLSKVQHTFADTMTEVTIGYPKSPLNGPSLRDAEPKAGERVVPVTDQTAVGSGELPLFALLAQENPATTKLVGRFEKLLDPQIRPPLHEGGIWLVRPDGYLACSSNDAEDIADFLNGISETGVR